MAQEQRALPDRLLQLSQRLEREAERESTAEAAAVAMLEAAAEMTQRHGLHRTARGVTMAAEMANREHPTKISVNLSTSR